MDFLNRHAARLTIVFAALFFTGCTNSEDATRALMSAGYTDIVIQGYDPFACSKDDTFSTKFIATNPNGNRVKGTVCSGLLFKGATIRY